MFIYSFQCRKNYDKIESDFLKAKIELQQSLERKELLTEHLCAIISHNEERKAERLKKLMEKIGISPDSGDLSDEELEHEQINETS